MLFDSIVNHLKNDEDTIDKYPSGRNFLEKIYIKILEGEKISKCEVELMKELIKAGYTTSISQNKLKTNGYMN